MSSGVSPQHFWSQLKLFVREDFKASFVRAMCNNTVYMQQRVQVDILDQLFPEGIKNPTGGQKYSDIWVLPPPGAYLQSSSSLDSFWGFGWTETHCTWRHAGPLIGLLRWWFLLKWEIVPSHYLVEMCRQVKMHVPLGVGSMSCSTSCVHPLDLSCKILVCFFCKNYKSQGFILLCFDATEWPMGLKKNHPQNP